MHGGVMMHKLNIEQNVDVSFLSPISEKEISEKTRNTKLHSQKIGSAVSKKQNSLMRK